MRAKIFNSEQVQVLSQMVEPFVEVFVEKVAAKVRELSQVREPRYYTRKEACKVLGVTLPTLNEYTKRGDLQSFRMSGRVLYDAWEVDDAIRTHSIYKGKRKGGSR